MYTSPEGEKYIINEFISGGSLQDYLITIEVPVKTLLGMMDDVASGMYYLASKQIVHRDLALRNLLIDSKTLRIKVSDLGLGISNDSKREKNESIAVRYEISLFTFLFFF